MGIDVLDIMFRAEKKFGVKLSHDDLEAIACDRDIVVGDLYDLILQKMHLRDFARYDVRLNYALWTQIRDDLHSVVDVPADQIELKTPLASLFPRDTRCEAWEALRETSPYRITSLGYPRAVRVAGFLLAVVMAAFEQFHIWQIPGAKWLWPLLGVLAIWMLAETYAKVLSFLAPFRKSFPAGMKTVKDLCRTVLATNYADFCSCAAIPLDDRSIAVWSNSRQYS